MPNISAKPSARYPWWCSIRSANAVAPVFCGGDRDRPDTGGAYAARRNGRRAHRSAATRSRSRAPFIAAVLTLSIRCARRGDQRICCWAFIRRCNSHCTVLSMTAVEIGASQRRATPGRCGMSGDIRLKLPQKPRHLARRRRSGRRCFSTGLEPPRRFVDEIHSPLDLTMPQTPTDPLDPGGKGSACRAIGGRGVRPAFGRLSHGLDPHGKMKPIQNMAYRSQTRRPTKRTRPRGTIAQDRHRRAGRRAQTLRHPSQLLALPVGLGRRSSRGGTLCSCRKRITSAAPRRAHSGVTETGS
jgi:hypothetical protein